MRIKDIIFGIVDIFIWYLFIYYWLFVIKNPVSLSLASFALVLFLIAGFLLCPFVYKSSAWKDLWNKKGELKVKDVLKSYENTGKEKK